MHSTETHAPDVFTVLTARWIAAGLVPLGTGVAVAGVTGRFWGLSPAAALAVGWVCGTAVGVPLAGWAARGLCARVTALESALGRRERDAADLRMAAADARAVSAEFVNTMNHELRTPLNAIMGFGHLLDNSALTPDQRECLQQVLRGGRHLLSLVNELPQVESAEPDPLIAIEVGDPCQSAK